MRATWPRPIILGIVGDSASGKTTLSKGLVRLLGEDVVTHICTDDYHKYDRKQRAERAITPLNPDCNYLDIMAAHLNDLRAGAPILKPVYQHKDGTFGPLVYVEPDPFAVVEGLLGYYTAEMREAYDVRVYLDPPESLRRKWKVDRDCAKRGYTTDQVLDDLDRREPDSAVVHPPAARARGHGRLPPAERRRPVRARRGPDAARLAAAPRPVAVRRRRRRLHDEQRARAAIAS